jgi:Cof subfamily protein (haloacid dehalogenase superfamily)
VPPTLVGLPPVRLVATDLDGTLLGPQGNVTLRAAAAVRAARRAGLPVVPMTGRPPRLTWKIAAEAGLGPLGVCSNGAVIVDLSSLSVLEVETIAPDVVTRIVTSLRETLPGIRFAAEDLASFIWEAGFATGATWQPLDGGARAPEVSDILSVTRPGLIKLVARRPGWPARVLLAALEREVAEEDGHVTSSGLDWVEVGASGVSKAYALERVCRRLNVAGTDVLAVGDNHNDLAVLAWCGHAAAPANAIPEVLAMVEHILPSNGDDGVAAMLEALCR